MKLKSPAGIAGVALLVLAGGVFADFWSAVPEGVERRFVGHEGKRPFEAFSDPVKTCVNHLAPGAYVVNREHALLGVIAHRFLDVLFVKGVKVISKARFHQIFETVQAKT